MIYIRTCQECGHEQESKDPKTYKGDGWKNIKCYRCQSEALDYGLWHPRDIEEENK